MAKTVFLPKITKSLALIRWQSVHSDHMMAVMHALEVQHFEAQTELLELLPALSENTSAQHSSCVTAWTMKELHTWHGSQAVGMVAKNKRFYHLEVVLDLM